MYKNVLLYMFMKNQNAIKKIEFEQWECNWKPKKKNNFPE